MSGFQRSYLLESHFPNGINLDKLKIEIIEGLNRTDHYLSLRVKKLIVRFTDGLSESEQLILDNVITTHNPSNNQISIDNEVDLKLEVQSVSMSSYQRISTYVYPGLKTGQKISQLKLLTQSTGTNGLQYQVRLVNLSSGLILMENSFNNTNEMIVSLNMNNGWPTEECICELQVRLVGGTGKVTIKSANLLFSR